MEKELLKEIEKELNFKERIILKLFKKTIDKIAIYFYNDRNKRRI